VEVDSVIQEKGFETKYILDVFKDIKLYFMILMYVGANCSVYAISFFLPSIIEGLGYSAAR